VSRLLNTQGISPLHREYIPQQQFFWCFEATVPCRLLFHALYHVHEHLQKLACSNSNVQVVDIPSRAQQWQCWMCWCLLSSVVLYYSACLCFSQQHIMTASL
jgi:hypothetical protein